VRRAAEADEPNVSCPGRALARAINSLTFLTGSEGCTSRTKGASATSEIGAKSAIESYGSFLNMTGLVACVVVVPMSNV
jgi:hypothetical protein